jgi:biopolymer transport protein ExbD
MASKRFRRRAIHEEQMSLQITSMADIFIIVLVFILKSYASGAMDIVPAAGLSLPTAVAEPTVTKSQRIEVAENSVLLEGKPVAALSGYSFASGSVDADGSNRALALTLAKGADAGRAEQKLLVVADRRAPYATIKTVLASAARGGYRKFEMAVQQAQ